MKFKTALVCLLLLWTSVSFADPIPVSYEIGDYSTSGYSASWLHESTGCEAEGPAGESLYMCGAKTAISGVISGMLDGGVLQITGGVLNVDGTEYQFLDGTLGNFADLLPGGAYGFSVAGLGAFFFEPLGMGAGLPNFFDGDSMILWGQNAAAYKCAPNQACDANRWGIDLYANRVTVSEPTTLALLGLGIAALGLQRRRRVVAPG